MQISDTIIACYRVYPEKNQPLRPFEKEIFSYSMNYKSSSFLKNNTQTAVINIINLRIIYKLHVSYASQHTFSKILTTI